MNRKRTLQDLRRAKSLSMDALGIQVGLTRQTVYKWERGITPVPVEYWEKLCSIFAVSEDELEDAVLETLLMRSLETLNPYGLRAAMKSGRYDTEKLQGVNERLLKNINSYGSNVVTAQVARGVTQLHNCTGVRVDPDQEESIGETARISVERYKAKILCAIIELELDPASKDMVLRAIQKI